MEKHPQDKSAVDTKNIPGQDPDRYEQGYGSFTEKDYDSKEADESRLNKTSGGTVTGDSDKANITTGMNEDKSTVSETSAPSKDVSEVQNDTNSNAS